MPASSPSIKIPEPAMRTLLLLARMDSGLFDRLLNALSVAKPEISTRNFSDEVVRLEPQLKESGFQDVVRELFNVHGLQDGLDITPAETGRLVARAMLADLPAVVPPITEADCDQLAERIAKVLTSGINFLTSAKARDVITEHAKVYRSARVLSDLRPVFDAEANRVCAMTAVHTLCIHFGQHDSCDDFHVALDDSDLVALRVALERAEKKAVILKGLTESQKIPYLSP